MFGVSGTWLVMLRSGVTQKGQLDQWRGVQGPLQSN